MTDEQKEEVRQQIYNVDRKYLEQILWNIFYLWDDEKVVAAWNLGYWSVRLSEAKSSGLRLIKSESGKQDDTLVKLKEKKKTSFHQFIHSSPMFRPFPGQRLPIYIGYEDQQEIEAKIKALPKKIIIKMFFEALKSSWPKKDAIAFIEAQQNQIALKKTGVDDDEQEELMDEILTVSKKLKNKGLIEMWPQV
jgi:hypothetical protein